MCKKSVKRSVLPPCCSCGWRYQLPPFSGATKHTITIAKTIKTKVTKTNDKWYQSVSMAKLQDSALLQQWRQLPSTPWRQQCTTEQLNQTNNNLVVTAGMFLWWACLPNDKIKQVKRCVHVPIEPTMTKCSHQNSTFNSTLLCYKHNSSPAFPLAAPMTN